MRHLALLTLFIGGCSWVGSGDLDCQLQLVDDDGDGYPLNEVEAGYEGNERCSHLVPVDCDDADASIHPDAEDAWYDGIDSDCALDDDYDQDLDGYVSDEHQGVATQGVEGSGTLPGGDCDDAALSVFPGANDPWYDGIDTDCAGDDDYDRDGDGYVADEYAGLATTYVDGSGSLPGGDCDDTVASTHPTAPDAWYDGIDHDCFGNEDYDQDADGYVPDEYEGLVTTYVDGSGSLPGGDCDDTDRRIHAGAEDLWYDGIDSDCMGDDDYDQDLDGYRDAATAKDGDDCDDVDATSYPGAPETVGDGVDHDCNGSADSFGLADLEDLVWEEPQSLLFRATDSTVYLGLHASELSIGSTDYYDTTIALAFDLADPSGGYYDDVTWLRNFADISPNVLTSGHDFFVSDGTLYGSIGIATSSTRQLVLRAWDLAKSTSSATNPPITEPLSFDDLSLAMDGAGNLHVVGCTETESDQSMAYLWTTPSTLQSNTYEDTYGSAIRARTCDLDFYAAEGGGTLILTEISTVGSGSPAPSRGLVDTADTGVVTDTGDTGGTEPAVEQEGLSFYTFDLPGSGGSTAMVRQSTIPDLVPATVQVHDASPNRLLVLTVPESNSVEVLLVDPSWNTTSIYSVPTKAGTIAYASSVFGDDGMLYVAAANDLGEMTLYIGKPGTLPTMQEVPFDLGFPVDETAVFVDALGTTLFLAASGYDSSLGVDRVVWGVAALQ